MINENELKGIHYSIMVELMLNSPVFSDELKDHLKWMKQAVDKGIEEHKNHIQR